MQYTGMLFLVVLVALCLAGCATMQGDAGPERTRAYNSSYSGPYLNRLAYPMGGMGAGMVCLEGTGALSHVSVRHCPRVHNAPHMYAALSIKGQGAKVLEGPVPKWRIFGAPGTGNGASRTSYGLPRFRGSTFLDRFPFGTVNLEDHTFPVEVEITGWSPFVPGHANLSCLPVAAMEYRFKNRSSQSMEAVFSFNSKNFMAEGKEGSSIRSVEGGFLLCQEGTKDHPEYEGAFALFTDEPDVCVDHSWFKGGWWDSVTLAWRNIEEGKCVNNPPQEGKSPGASFFVPFTLDGGQEKTVRLLMAWYVPKSSLRTGKDPEGATPVKGNHVPWYAGPSGFKDIHALARYFLAEYDGLRSKSALFRDTFYDTTLPDEVVEAVAANLTILKAPTMLRQADGRLWCWEGCCDEKGCCSGSCTHVWNYAQAVAHLFPDLERTLRRTEFNESQNEEGHQTFRSALPIRPVAHTFHAASDGQLGGIMKVFREWRIQGDLSWLKAFWPKVKTSLDYCIRSWDPKGKGILEEPHHNTYDIEFWGPDGMCTSFYLGALLAAKEMGSALGEDVSQYATLLEKGKAFLEQELFDGEYFYQKVQWEGLEAGYESLPSDANGPGYEEAVKLLNREGPKYQYGTGCLSDVVLGFWIARMAGLPEIVDPAMVKSTLKSIHQYNLKHDLTDHPNPQRPAFAMGRDGGLLLCSWPKGGALSLPFVYSNEVWTGIEYQVASHCMLEGLVEEGLEIVRTCRDRYNGIIRNPFDEYECGHWYARALSSYGLIQGLTGVRYDAVDKTLHIDSRVGDDFRSFLSTATGFGTVGLKGGKPFVEMKMGTLDVQRVLVSGKEMSL